MSAIYEVLSHEIDPVYLAEVEMNVERYTKLDLEINRKHSVEDAALSIAHIEAIDRRLKCLK